MKRFIDWIKNFFRKPVPQKKIVHVQKLTHVLHGNGTRAVTEEDKSQYLKQLAICLNSRMNEYPKWEDVVEAMIEAHSGNFNQLQDIVKKRANIKAKYPKPEII